MSAGFRLAGSILGGELRYAIDPTWFEKIDERIFTHRVFLDRLVLDVREGQAAVERASAFKRPELLKKQADVVQCMETLKAAYLEMLDERSAYEASILRITQGRLAD